jgi:hypothetical protein
VSGAKTGLFLTGSGHFPGAFKVMRPWLSQGKNTFSADADGRAINKQAPRAIDKAP